MSVRHSYTLTRFASPTIAAVLSIMAWPVTTEAAPASITVLAERDLEFGIIAVPTTGWRSVSVLGEVRESGVLSFPGSAIGPGRYSIIFDRGNESNRSLDVLVQVMMIAPRNFVEGGVNASLSSLATDLPNAVSTTSGLTATVRMANCRERRCTASFNVGGRIDISRSRGGAALRIPVAVTATIISVN